MKQENQETFAYYIRGATCFACITSHLEKYHCFTIAEFMTESVQTTLGCVNLAYRGCSHKRSCS